MAATATKSTNGVEGKSLPPVEEGQMRIPRIALRELIVRIKGTTPLITQRFGDRAMKQIADKQQKVAKLEKTARVPHEEFLDALYVIQEPSAPDKADGVYGLPAAGVKKALVSAGGRFADEKMTYLRGVLNIGGEGYVPIISEDENGLPEEPDLR